MENVHPVFGAGNSNAQPSDYESPTLTPRPEFPTSPVTLLTRE